MRIVVTHITQMGEQHVCVAGIDEARVHVRPQTHAGGPLGPDSLLENGGPFALGLEVDLGAGTPLPVRPHIEDFVCDPAVAQILRPLPPAEFWNQIHEVSQPSLREIFGDALHRRGHSCVTDYGQGAASLGFLRPTGAELLLDQERGPRVSLSDGTFEPNVALNDLRFGSLPLDAVAGLIDDANRRIRTGEDLILGVGLTRFWEGYHWLQVTGIFLHDSPLSLAT